jgi:hypothetical protein
VLGESRSRKPWYWWELDGNLIVSLHINLLKGCLVSLAMSCNVKRLPQYWISPYTTVPARRSDVGYGRLLVYITELESLF